MSQLNITPTPLRRSP